MSGHTLLAVDLNHPESWERALPEALTLARAKTSTLHLVQVVPDFGMAMVGEFFPPDFEHKALEKARDDLRAFGEQHVPDDIEWDVHLGHGDVAEELIRVAHDVGATTIVMASHPPHGVTRFLLGSQAERLVHRSPVSVLVVRDGSAE